jgi:hypothetical protein
MQSNGARVERVPGGTMTHRIGRAAVLAAAVLALSAGAALAHEEREIGDYSFEVGFIDEPVFTGQKSGLEFFVMNGDEPVEGLEATLEAEVRFGSQTRDLEISPRFGEPGAYESVFFPTAAGPYTFRIYGDLEGTAIDESFTSSPDGFGEVEELAGGQFPVQFPSTGDVVADAQAGANAATQATIALVLAVIGMLAALVALGLTVARRSS